MTKAFEHLINHGHSLAEFRDISDEYDRIPAMVRRLGTASSGERAMILAAISLLPEAWVEEALEGESSTLSIPSFRLNDLGSLDGQNVRSLVEAIAIHADHAEVVR